MLFHKAKNGAKGNAATNIVTKPYCRTKIKMKEHKKARITKICMNNFFLQKHTVKIGATFV